MKARRGQWEVGSWCQQSSGYPWQRACSAWPRCAARWHRSRAGIATYRNERHGFSLSYPAGTFAAQPPPADGEGRVFVSRDGNARLLAGALPNADGVNLRDYRALVLQQSYPGAAIDYAPVARHVVRALRHRATASCSTSA